MGTFKQPATTVAIGGFGCAYEKHFEVLFNGFFLKNERPKSGVYRDTFFRTDLFSAQGS